MALSSKRRRQLPDSAFVYPKTRRYPIDTPKRARNALARSAQRNTAGSYRTVAKAVRQRYGSKIAIGGKTASKSGRSRSTSRGRKR